MYLCISVFSHFLMQPTIENLWIGKLTTNNKKKDIGPTKYPREKTLDSQNTHEKKNLDPPK